MFLQTYSHPLSWSFITIMSSTQLQYELVCFDEMVTEIFHLPPAWMTRYTPLSR